jgi:hypothetical protein
VSLNKCASTLQRWCKGDASSSLSSYRRKAGALPGCLRLSISEHRHWHKLEYQDVTLEAAVEQAAAWAEKFVEEFSAYQIATLPWLKKYPHGTESSPMTWSTHVGMLR